MTFNCEKEKIPIEELSAAFAPVPSHTVIYRSLNYDIITRSSVAPHIFRPMENKLGVIFITLPMLHKRPSTCGRMR